MFYSHSEKITSIYFNEDIMKDDTDLQPVLDKLNEMTEELMQHMAEEEHVHDENCNHDHDEE